MDHRDTTVGRPERRRPRPSNRPNTVTIAALVAVAAAVAIGAWLLLRGDDDAGAPKVEPVAATVADLRALADEVEHPVYWAGARPGNTYELTRTPDGRIYIRYLPRGTELGDPSPTFTSIGTYPQADAFGATEQVAAQAGAKSYNTKTGALVVQDPDKPTSVYFAFKDVPYLVEVFDPSAAKALDLALSGKVRLLP